MVTDGSQTYPGGHFAMYTNVESVCRTLETNIILYVNYTSKRKKKKEQSLGYLSLGSESGASEKYFCI